MILPPAATNWKPVPFSCLLMYLLSALLMTGCSNSKSDLLDIQDKPPVAQALPLLTPGNHLSFIKGFNAVNPPQTELEIESRWSEALSNGMDVGRIQFGWDELEPQPNLYDMQEIEAALADMQSAGLQPFVLITTIDSESFTLPSDLVEQNNPLALVNGMQIDDPVILSRFAALLDWVIPLATSYGGWVLSVGNEPDNYLEDFPNAEKTFVNFLVAAKAHARTINPELAITMTLTQGALERGKSYVAAFLEESDVASFNYYGTTGDNFSKSPVSVSADIKQMLDVSGTKFLILQELGYAGGYEDQVSPMGASLGDQQQFFENVFSELEAEPRFRVAVVFQLVDWDPDLVDTFYSQPFRDEGLPQDFIDRFAESLETTGLIRYADGSSRPAWTTFVTWLGKFQM